MPNWIGFDSDIQAAIYNELVELHELQDSPEAKKLQKLIDGVDFWKTYVGPFLDRVCEDAGVEL